MKRSQWNDKTWQRILSEVQANLAVGSEILELSCGRGQLLAQLQEAGYKATGTNYSNYANALTNVQIINGIDATNISFDTGLDPDKKYDCVILSEALQNICNHSAVYNSVVKILKEGGLFIVSTPNIMNIKSRLHFLMTGFFKVKWNFIGYDVPLNEAFCYHNHPVHLPVDIYYAKAAGLDLHALDGVKIKFKSLFMYAIFFLPIYFFTKINVCHKEPFIIQSQSSKQVLCVLTQFETLVAERLLLIYAKKTPSPKSRVTPHIDWYQKG